MPFEHETKFVVSLDATPEWIERLPGVIPIKTQDLFQVYLNDGIRLRHTHTETDPLSLDTYIMAYKRRTSRGPIEIETEISQVDFEALVEGEARTIRKTRHTFSHEGTSLDLELDTYSGETGAAFLRVIEVEFDLEEAAKLSVIAALLGDRLVRQIDPEADGRFANHRLCNRYYALGLAHETYQGHRPRRQAA